MIEIISDSYRSITSVILHFFNRTHFTKHPGLSMHSSTYDGSPALDKTKAMLALKLKGIIQWFDFRTNFTKYRLSSHKILSYLFKWIYSKE